MVAFNAALLFAISAAASILPRDFSQVKADLVKTNSDTQALTSAINSWDGSVGGSAAVQSKEQTVEKDIENTTTDTNNSAAATSTEANDIISYINSTLEPSIKTAIQAIVNNKGRVTSAGLTTLVRNDLNNLKSKTTTLGNALVGKAPSAQQSAAQSALDAVLADIQSGINSYA